MRMRRPPLIDINSAIDTLLHALRKDTIVLDNSGLPAEDQEGYKAEVARDLLDFLEEVKNERR